MSRLRFSAEGALRALQISNAKILIFVEGGLDRAFADRAIRSIGRGQISNYQVRSAKEFSGTGGKPELIKLFKLLRSKSMLEAVSFGKQSYALFLMDKDVDDLTKRLLRSKHVVYTRTYDLEGALFLAGDVKKAFADACLVTLEQAGDMMTDGLNFAIDVASLWADWIALCMVSAKLKVNCGCTFDRPSTINTPPLSPSAHAEADSMQNSIANVANIEILHVGKLFASMRRRHIASISAHEPFKYFKGKWLAHLLDAHCQTVSKVPDGCFSAVFDRMIVALLTQVCKSNISTFWGDFHSALLNAEDLALQSQKESRRPRAPVCLNPDAPRQKKVPKKEMVAIASPVSKDPTKSRTRGPV